VFYKALWGQRPYNDEDLKKSDSRVDEDIFIGYSSRIKSYKCYNTKLHKIVESVNVKVDEARQQKVKPQENVHADEPSCKEEKE
jgi:hypothetical protein